MMRALAQLGLVCVLGIWATGCESKAGSGALIGAGTGAAAGGILGHQSGKTGQGALIGGAIGAIGGGLVGHSMDENDKKEAREREEDAYARDYDRRHGSRSDSRSRASEMDVITKDDVITWTARGVRDDIIIDRIDRSGTVFRLSAAEQTELRDEGVSESVIRAMKDTTRR